MLTCDSLYGHRDLIESEGFVKEYQQDIILSKTHSYIEFSIMSRFDFDLGYVSKCLGIEPSVQYNIGDKIKGTNKEYNCTMWQYQTDITNELDLSTLLSEIQGKFGTPDQISALREIKKRFRGVIIGIDVVVSIRDMEPPGIYFDEQFNRFVSDIGGFIDIDMYDA